MIVIYIESLDFFTVFLNRRKKIIKIVSLKVLHPRKPSPNCLPVGVRTRYYKPRFNVSQTCWMLQSLDGAVIPEWPCSMLGHEGPIPRIWRAKRKYFVFFLYKDRILRKMYKTKPYKYTIGIFLSWLGSRIFTLRDTFSRHRAKCGLISFHYIYIHIYIYIYTNWRHSNGANIWRHIFLYKFPQLFVKFHSF